MALECIITVFVTNLHLLQIASKFPVNSTMTPLIIDIYLKGGF